MEGGIFVDKTSPKTLGILGGLGPMSSVYFYEMITKHTYAECDQDHLNILLSSRADIPDRTAYILDKTAPNPIYSMQAEVEKQLDQLINKPQALPGSSK